MTPKEKADKLIEMTEYANVTSDQTAPLCREYAINISLKFVDELLKDCILSEQNRFDFWHDVKIELLLKQQSH